MKVTTKSEYACLALIELSKQYGGKPISVEEIAGGLNVSKNYLEQILLSLRHNGYLKSYRGYNGGYILNKAPDEINIAEIVRLMDGTLAPYDCVSMIEHFDCPQNIDCRLKEVWALVRTTILDVLENITFADIIDKNINLTDLTGNGDRKTEDGR